MSRRTGFTQSELNQLHGLTSRGYPIVPPVPSPTEPLPFTKEELARLRDGWGPDYKPLIDRFMATIDALTRENEAR